MALETSGHFDFDKMKKILKRMDLIFVDIKLMEDKQHKIFTGRGNKLILENIQKIDALTKDIVIRIPLIEGVNASADNIGETISFVKKHLKKSKIELLPYHTLGHYKYQQLGINPPSSSFSTPSKSTLLSFEKMIEEQGAIVVHY